MKLSIVEKLRTGHVKRWQIVRVAREQTIAEHMYRVAIIAEAMAEAMGFDGYAINDIRNWALIHDLPEVIIGDIPTPTKRAMRGPMTDLELSVDSDFRDKYEHLAEYQPVVLEVVKLADLAEAIDFLDVEGLGQHAKDVQGKLHGELIMKIGSCKRNYPEYQWDDAYQVFREVQGVPKWMTIK